MMRISGITRLVQRHDYKLYCAIHGGVPCVFRKGQRVETVEHNGHVIHFVRENPHFVFALTHNWSLSGRPAEWGSLPIMKKLNDLDLWKRDLVSEIEANDEKRRMREARDLENKNEDFLKENRSLFQKAFGDVLTGNLDKKDIRRTHEKRVKQ